MREIKHLAIRLSQPTSGRQTSQSVIDAHNAIVRERGECAFGKFGAQISKGTKDFIDTQIENLEPTYLYVILRKGSNVAAFRAGIKKIILSVDRDNFSQLGFPGYYPERPASAIVLSEELKASKIDNLIVASSERPLLDAILSSRTPLMLVCPQGGKLKGEDNEQ